jgi:hypothetical protein
MDAQEIKHPAGQAQQTVSINTFQATSRRIDIRHISGLAVTL